MHFLTLSVLVCAEIFFSFKGVIPRGKEKEKTLEKLPPKPQNTWYMYNRFYKVISTTH